MPQLIDISPLINEKLAVFPGDTPFSRKHLLKCAAGNNIDLSTITTTVHLGAHADAPSHYHKDGVGISARDLSIYYGGCQIIKISKKPNERIYPEDIKNIKITEERILFRTDSFNDPYTWKNDFNALSGELINYLSEKNVKLVGIDTPSIDPAEEKVLSSHLAVYENDMAILEGIILTDIAEGKYLLSAFPLKIEGADASPVRAVLIKE